MFVFLEAMRKPEIDMEARKQANIAAAQEKQTEQKLALMQGGANALNTVLDPSQKQNICGDLSLIQKIKDAPAMQISSAEMPIWDPITKEQNGVVKTIVITIPNPDYIDAKKRFDLIAGDLEHRSPGAYQSAERGNMEEKWIPEIAKPYLEARHNLENLKDKKRIYVVQTSTVAVKTEENPNRQETVTETAISTNPPAYYATKETVAYNIKEDGVTKLKAYNGDANIEVAANYFNNTGNMMQSYDPALIAENGNLKSEAPAARDMKFYSEVKIGDKTYYFQLEQPPDIALEKNAKTESIMK